MDLARRLWRLKPTVRARWAAPGGDIAIGNPPVRPGEKLGYEELLDWRQPHAHHAPGAFWQGTEEYRSWPDLYAAAIPARCSVQQR